MSKYYIIAELNGYIIKTSYMVDSAQEAFDEFKRDDKYEGFEITMLFQGDAF